MARTDLAIAKRDGRYLVVIDTGPAAGMSIAGARLKRDAEADADRLAGEPWAHLYPTVKAAAESDGVLTATVPIAELRIERNELLKLRRDNEAMRRMLVELNPAIVERWGQGGAMVTDRYRATVKAEAEAKLLAGDEARADHLGGTR
jgi:hypothetical protein